MQELVIILVRGIGTGALFALVAVSLNLIYNASGVLNFAQGQFLILAGVAAYFWAPTTAASPMWWVILIVTVIVISGLGALQGVLTLLPMRSALDQHSWIITTIAASIVLGAVMLLTVGPRSISVGDPFPSFPLVGTKAPGAYLVLIVFLLVVLIGLRLYQRKMLSGLALNALSQDVAAARTAGVHTMRLQTLAFAIAAAITAATGFMGASLIQISESQALHYVIFGFTVAVIGGIGNNVGAVFAGLSFGVILMAVTYFFGGNAQLPATLLLIVAVLMLKPQGIFGRPHARRV